MDAQYIKVCPALATNINMIRSDSEFVSLEKSEIADAIYGIMTAKENTQDKRTLERLESAMNIVTSYLFIIDLIKD